MTSLALSPSEGFVLSRVDGRATLQEIAETTGLPFAEIETALRKLVDQGAVEWSVMSTSAAAARGFLGAQRTSDRREITSGAGFHAPQRGIVEDTRSKPPGAQVSQAPQNRSVSQGVPKTTQLSARVAEDVSKLELEPERRKKIDDMYIVLDMMNHYDVLGLPRDADKAKIRSAYFELSKQYHPDTLFRKNLGSYKPKMEAIFKRLTDAYEVLSKSKARADYDSSLPPPVANPAAKLATPQAATPQAAQPVKPSAPQQNAQAMPASAPPVAPPGPKPRGKSEHRLQAMRVELEEKKASAQRLADEATKARVTRGEPPPQPPQNDVGFRMSVPRGPAGSLRDLLPHAPPSAAQRSSPAPRSNPSSLPSPERLGSDPAGPRTIVLSSEPPAKASVFPTRGSIPADPARASRLPPALLRDLATSMKSTGNMPPSDVLTRLRREADSLVAAGDFRQARERLKVAVSMDDGAELRAFYDDVCRRDDAARAHDIEEQANRHEANRQWAEAAVCWIRVRDVREHDANANAKAARNLLRAEGDLRLVHKYATIALEIDPNMASARKTLAVFYVRSKMVERARRELERALQLLPTDDSLKKMLADLPPPKPDSR